MAIQSEWLEKDYYAALGVSETATADEITKAYRRLARQLHPDARPGDEVAEERFKEISAAYEVIGDPAKRAEYDEARRLAAAGVGAGASRGGFRVHVTNVDGLGGFEFDDFFGGVFGSGTSRRRPTQTRRGRDREAEVRLRFEDAVFGVTTEINDVKVRVPPGVRDGQVIRIPGRGDPGVNGGPPGDLYVRVRVLPHKVFGRNGRDLTVTVPITYPEAVLGADVRVPTIDGSQVTVRVPAGTPSGRVLRVRGHGVAGRNGRGDLLVTVEIAVPQKTSAKERKCLEALAKSMTWSPREELGV